MNMTWKIFMIIIIINDYNLINNKIKTIWKKESKKTKLINKKKIKYLANNKIFLFDNN